jgi:hypothetical protein
LRRTTIYLSPEQWKQARILAAERDTDASSIIREILKAALVDGKFEW